MSIDAIYPEAPKPINLEMSEKKEIKTMSWKLVGQLTVGAALVGGGLVVMGMYHKSSAKMTIDPYSQTIAKESIVLEKVHTYCFPLLEQTKDESTCKLWLKKYRALDRYAYSDSDEDTDNVQSEAETGEQKLEKLSESQAGNAQSPTN